MNAAATASRILGMPIATVIVAGRLVVAPDGRQTYWQAASMWWNRPARRPVAWTS